MRLGLESVGTVRQFGGIVPGLGWFRDLFRLAWERGSLGSQMTAIWKCMHHARDLPDMYCPVLFLGQATCMVISSQPAVSCDVARVVLLEVKVVAARFGAGISVFGIVGSPRPLEQTAKAYIM
jgi:hypothetical protein